MADAKTGEPTRTPRASDGRETSSRETEAREMTFDPSQHSEMLPVPEKRDGIEYRYVRIEARGRLDTQNYTNALRAQWVPCNLKDLPELEYVMSDINHPLQEKNSDAIVVGGLVLCQRAAAIGEQMRKAANDESNRTLRALDNNYLNDSDQRMPKFSERSSSVRFGD